MASDQIIVTELALQSQCFQWHWNHFPAERGCLFHVNNKAKNAIEGNRMKAIGVVKGVSDLILVRPGKVVFMELKTASGAQSPEQRRFQQQVESRGHQYRIIRSLEEFKAIVNPI